MNILRYIAIAAIPLLFAITLHEAAHGWLASKLGDKTAKMLGRVSLNPTKHIDLFGTIILPIVMLVASGGSFLFGYAKPVPITWKNLKNQRRDMALVAIAGPLANLLMAFFWAAVVKLSMISPSHSTIGIIRGFIIYLQLAGTYGIFINILLMLFNLIPIPPLDGSRVIASLLPTRAAYEYNKIEPFGFWIILALFFFGITSRVLFPIVYGAYNWIASLFHLVPLGF